VVVQGQGIDIRRGSQDWGVRSAEHKISTGGRESFRKTRGGPESIVILGAKGGAKGGVEVIA
jgi:hypothetical protein